MKEVIFISCYSPRYAIMDNLSVDYKLYLKSQGRSLPKPHFVSKQVYDDFQDSFLKKRVMIPCGKCIGCRLDYSRTWAVRCMLEARQHKYNWFLTLTYDDDHVPVRFSDGVDASTGEVLPDEVVSYTLQKEHVSEFMKRLRSRVEDNNIEHDHIKFFACGEYGDQTFRPHYHLLLFGCDIPDLEFYKYKGGNAYYTSKMLNDIWSDGIGKNRSSRGFVIVGDVSFQSASYVARYCTKKALKGISSEFYSDVGIEPEFTLMSRRPGIAREYFDEKSGQIYDCDSLTVVGSDGSPLVVKPPRYFDRLMEIDDPHFIKSVKDERKRVGALSRDVVLSNTSLSDDQYLAVQRDNKLAVISALKRGDI